jgi:MoCo/4Fe-4S cofactor protein with predicted Tat translocation signal
MEKQNKIYWKGVEELANHPEFLKHAEKEFPEDLPYDKGRLIEEGDNSSRRDFLKLMGFSLAAASLAACEAPVRKAIPYLNKPVDVNPGIPNYYASSFVNGGEYCSVLVKTREGRPIKIEPNHLSPVSGGGTSLRAQASVLSLYDRERLNGPRVKGSPASWDDVDQLVASRLAEAAAGNGKIRVVSRTIMSPSTRAVLNKFSERFPTAELVMYDPVSAAGLVGAHQLAFGKAMLPDFRFDKAWTIVSFNADFLGTWINPTRFSADFALNRKLGGGVSQMSRLYQFEANLSLTGANADVRIPLRPSREGLAVARLYNLLASKAGAELLQMPDFQSEGLEAAAADLWSNRGQSIVVAGSNDVHVQLVVAAINQLLGNYGTTIQTDRPLHLRQGDDRNMADFVRELSAGEVEAVIFLGCNPVYDHYLGQQIAAGLKQVSFTVSTSDRLDETASETEVVAPDHHYLESWGDAHPREGSYSLIQPAISPLFDTRQAQETLLKWAGEPDTDYYTFVRQYWRDNLFGQQSNTADFDTFWDKSLHDGHFEVEAASAGSALSWGGDLSAAAVAIGKNYQPAHEGIELALYEKAAIGDGSMANNPWLQEVPDPISKACWDNYITMNPVMAKEMGISMVEGKTLLAELIVGDQRMTLPVMVQPGQARGTLGLALGYGRTKAGKVADGVGVNAFPLIREIEGLPVLNCTVNVGISLSGGAYQIAQTQTHNTFMNRNFVIQEATLPEYKNNPFAGRHIPKISTSQALDAKLGDHEPDGKVPPHYLTMWKGHDYNNHHWAMAIDLNSCTGCGVCTVACQSENNVPVVGREEVINRREMHWIRIDRYYSSRPGALTYQELEEAAEYPEVTFQPMMCQHCNNAPCETVCPVAATTHSTEGLNQMAYNRCIGTRYCANNCPYKVRRFNWFKYHDNKQFDTNLPMNNDLGKMVLNPDVTVRSRGVMEKCTFCVQRIQYGKLEAKKEGRRPVDGEITPACASACPTKAIVFGDIRDPESHVTKLIQLVDEGERQEVREPRAYHVLEEVNALPNIWYFSKIRNKEEHA